MRRVLARLIGTARHARADAELEREMAAHLSLLEDDFRRRGLAAADARAAAQRALGSPARSRAIASLAAFSFARATITIDGDATRMDGFGVSAGFFPMLGVAPFIGRTFAPEESIAGRDRVLVLAYDAWQRFGGDARVLGRTVAFTGNSLGWFSGGIVPEVPYTIVGVMPPGFHFPYDNAQFWIPRAPARSPDGRPVRRETVARLADGVTPVAAAAEMAAIRSDVRGASTSMVGGRPRYELIPVQDELTGPVRPALLVLMAAVGVVLLIACVNVANLLLARTASRQREIAVRAAIGAGPGRLVRQLITESLLLAGLGGVFGIALAFGGVRLFRLLATTLGRSDLGLASVFPRLSEVSVDAAALGYALAVSIATGLVFGLAPALRHARPRHAALLRDLSASPRSTIGGSLVVVEIALATVLLVGAGLLITSFVKLSTVDPGFEPTHVLTVQVLQSTSPRPEQQRVFAETFVERLRGGPEVQAAAWGRR